jgi:hypothetical protein
MRREFSGRLGECRFGECQASGIRTSDAPCLGWVSAVRISDIGVRFRPNTGRGGQLAAELVVQFGMVAAGINVVLKRLYGSCVALVFT